MSLKVKSFLIGFNIFLLVVLISNVKPLMFVPSTKTNSYVADIVRGFVFSLTKINWNYGFFTSEKFGFFSYDFKLYNPLLKDTLLISRDKNLDYIISDYNYIRFASFLPSMLISDSLYTEACARSLALHLFNKYPQYNNLDIFIYNHNMKVEKQQGRFDLSISKLQVYDRHLYY